jgi:arginase family enzyme
MSFDFLTPIKDTILAHLVLQSAQSLGKNIQVYTSQDNFPDLEKVQVAIFGVQEDRNALDNMNCGDNLDAIRKHLYQLFPGNWHTNIVDLGNIEKGNTVEDTYFAVSTLANYLIKNQIIPVIIGGSQDITYANYRGYDTLEQTVNIVSVDSKFDIGSTEDELNSRSYLSKIVMDKPNNLFNFSNIGYQTYYNSQEELDLLNSLFFDAFRLGEVKDLTKVEPILRDADLVSIDIGSIRQSEAPANNNCSPNGFYGKEICAISRYAGISDKVSSFGIYEYNPKHDRNYQTAHLIAQMIWYFIEGVNFRAKDYPYCTKESYQKFIVMLENDDPINFYKSDKSGRWWMEINIITNNKYRRHALIPCTYQDYLEATEQKVPERWYNAQRKLI